MSKPPKKNLTKGEILNIAREQYTRGLEFTVGDGVDHLNIYKTSRMDNCWCVYVTKKNPDNILSSSEVIIISKETGEVVYHGPANDEG